MKLQQGLAAALLFLLTGICAAAAPGVQVPRLRWHVLKIEPAAESVRRRLSGAGLEVLGTGPEGGLKVLATDSQRDWLATQDLAVQTVVEDYGLALAERNRSRAALAAVDNFAVGKMGGYFSPEEVAAFVDSLIAGDTYGIISERFEIGRSQWGAPIWMVEVAAPGDSGWDRPRVFYNSLIHSREGESLMALLYYLRFLTENYGRADSVTDLVNSRRMYFLPVANPDGYEINWRQYRDHGSFGLWRKNARDNNGNGLLDDLDGVDLNRNFSYKWGYDNLGSTNDPRFDSYRGPQALSEPETISLRDFINSHPLAAAINLHTYGRVLINPYGYVDLQTPDSLLYKRLGSRLTAASGYRFGNVSQTLGSFYHVNGEMTDWEYADTADRGKIIAWSVEVGPDADGFWPAQDRITPLAEENLALFYGLAQISGCWPELDSLGLTYDPGDSSRLTLRPWLSNAGVNVNRQPLSLRLEEYTGELASLDSSLRLEDIPAGAVPGTTSGEVRVKFLPSVYQARPRLCLYEGGQRLRTFRLELSRPRNLAADVTRDGRTDVFDLLALLKVLAAGVPAGEEASVYDLNQDGKVDIFDLLALLKGF